MLNRFTFLIIIYIVAFLGMISAISYSGHDEFFFATVVLFFSFANFSTAIINGLAAGYYFEKEYKKRRIPIWMQIAYCLMTLFVSIFLLRDESKEGIDLVLLFSGCMSIGVMILFRYIGRFIKKFSTKKKDFKS